MYTVDFNHPNHIYFVGIGGISMSGIAELLSHAGFKVSGSDWHETEITDNLTKQGIEVFYGEDPSHIPSDIDCAVLTSAVRDTNKEYIRLKEMNVPILKRAELLGQIMKNYELPICVSGTHGKTTTTSMISEILLTADADPTLSIGGIYKKIGGNVRIGSKKYFVAESCEYTNSFLSFFPKVGVILNVDADHLDFFKDLDEIRASFLKFARLIPEDGTLIINADIPDVRYFTDNVKCKVITYSAENTILYGKPIDYTAKDISFNDFGLPSFTCINETFKETPVSLKVPGLHNISNALAAIAFADLVKINREVSAKGLLSYTGTDRRFEYKGEVNGFTVIDDYAHHPTEIKATLNAALKYPHNRLVCVFQPHTYTRTKHHMEEFAEALSIADEVILADIYAARETDNLGISSETLCDRIKAIKGNSCYFKSFEEIQNYIMTSCIKGDLLITMGAGNVHEIGENLLK